MAKRWWCLAGALLAVAFGALGYFLLFLGMGLAAHAAAADRELRALVDRRATAATLIYAAMAAAALAGCLLAWWRWPTRPASARRLAYASGLAAALLPVLAYAAVWLAARVAR